MFTFLRKKALLAILFLMSGIISSFAAPSGSGTEADPYLIGSAEDLVWFRDYVNQPNLTSCAKLTADIDLKDVCHPASDGVEEVSWEPINAYLGTFDGNGKKIKNLYYSSNNDCGFFKNLYGTIKNVCFVDANITGTGTGYYGVVAAATQNATLDNITIERGSTIQGRKYTGGCVGQAYMSKFTNCTNNATISATECYIGGICGLSDGSTFINCKNLGNIKAAAHVGGITGLVNYYKKSAFKDCANYGDIESNNNNYSYSAAGGIVGECYNTTLELNNVFNTGNITSPELGYPGFILGHIVNNTTTIIVTGTIAYNTNSILKKGETVQPAAAVGYGTLNEVLSFDAETIKTGLLAALLQQNATDGTVWGQQLGTDEYPVLGSSYMVYATKDIQVSCLGNIINTDATFTNTEQETAGTITISHCDNPTHHEAVEATCTTGGNVEYYECTFCHKSFSNLDLTEEIASPTVSALGHDYVDCACTRCEDKIEFQTLKEGITTIQIKAVNGEVSKIEGNRDNLYQFTAPGDGTLTVYTTGDEDTYGTLWGSGSQTSCLTSNDDDGEGHNFKFTYEVTKGTVYYIGARQYGGYEIGDYSITIEGTWPHEMEELTITDKEAVEFTTEYAVTTLTYKRTFNNTNWQPLYVPFAMASADWKDKGLEVACINNFHEYNTSEGKKVVLEVNKVTAGVLHPNTPYLIRATEVGEKTITLNDVTLLTAEDTYTCSSMTRNYNFKGIYSEKSSFDAENDYIVSGGSLMHISDDAVLSPQRWYVNVDVDNRYTMIDAEEAAAQARSISIVVVGESSVTGIEEVGVKVDDVSSDALGIYDLQGRRLGSEPKQGVFIMNGKKFVK